MKNLARIEGTFTIPVIARIGIDKDIDAQIQIMLEHGEAIVLSLAGIDQPKLRSLLRVSLNSHPEKKSALKEYLREGLPSPENQSPEIRESPQSVKKELLDDGPTSED
jgi:hypothetical protein